MAAFPQQTIEDNLRRGGWPELYVNETLDPVRYLNDYFRNYVERDVVMAAGVHKVNAFTKVIGLLAARTGSILSISDIASPSGVEVSTVSDWISIIERTGLVVRLPAFFNNLNKRLIKSPKIHVIDAALAARLQGWTTIEPLLLSPQMGGIFESLVVGEVIKTRDNFMKDWQLFYWRTKDGDEVDMLVQDGNGRCVAIEVKSASHDVSGVSIPAALRKDLPGLQEMWVVTRGGAMRHVSRDVRQVPVAHLRNELLSVFGR
jgi:predicted AAA+ superfamily ATPase